MESLASIRPAVDRIEPTHRHRIPAPQRESHVSVLETLSPEMARELGDAFSLATIGQRPLPEKRRNDRSGGARQSVFKLVSRVAAFVLVSSIAVLLTVAALYLMRLS